MESNRQTDRVCIVATQPATFERCRRGLYPSPASYDRVDQPFEYMAFYRTAPVSAVTQYAPVVNRQRQHRGEPGPFSEEDWAETIDPFSDTDEIIVFELDELREIDEQVTNDGSGVRGAWYCLLEHLLCADTLGDIRNTD